jgi:ribosomal protein S18 acetylase RimI-like enzyme
MPCRASASRCRVQVTSNVRHLQAKMRIRRYDIADWDAVCSIYDLAKPDELRGELKVPLIPPLANDAEMRTLFHESEVFVAERDNQLVGFTGTRGNRISWLFVHPLHRRARIAESLVREAIRGLHGEIALNVLKSNKAASRLYEKLGFVVQHEFSGNFKGQECQVVRLCHRKDA